MQKFFITLLFIETIVASLMIQITGHHIALTVDLNRYMSYVYGYPMEMYVSTGWNKSPCNNDKYSWLDEGIPSAYTAKLFAPCEKTLAIEGFPCYPRTGVFLFEYHTEGWLYGSNLNSFLLLPIPPIVRLFCNSIYIALTLYAPVYYARWFSVNTSLSSKTLWIISLFLQILIVAMCLRVIVSFSCAHNWFYYILYTINTFNLLILTLFALNFVKNRSKTLYSKCGAHLYRTV